MIRPENVYVSKRERTDSTGDLWLHFDMRLLVELSPKTARSLVYELADQLGMFTCDRSGVAEASQ
ncbi:hypothetical protein [Streptomyces mirabilis]|uniref:hypothetical protein n=1 Tax=Streptomyces mirabilis TaxID=68239 RepID=UPI0036CF5DAF